MVVDMVLAECSHQRELVMRYDLWKIKARVSDGLTKAKGVAPESLLALNTALLAMQYIDWSYWKTSDQVETQIEVAFNAI